MKRHNNGIAEEHIVAYLDGELNVNDEMREALGDAELRQVATEYALLKKIFHRSGTEQRFLLGTASDSRALAYLHNVLRSGKANIPMAADADAVRMPARVAVTKKVWVRRSAIGFALTLLLGAFWFVTKPSEVPTEPIVATHTVQQEQAAPNTTGNVNTPAPGVVTAPEAPAASPTVAANYNPSKKLSNRQTHAAPKTNVVAEPASIEKANIVSAQPDQPADIMISRRYAKLMKNVRIVEVTQQDKM